MFNYNTYQNKVSASQSEQKTNKKIYIRKPPQQWDNEIQIPESNMQNKSDKIGENP